MADGGAMSGVVKLVVRTFIEEEHYSQLYDMLSQQWCDAHPLSAAMKLMEQYGVKITQEEQDRFKDMDEERLITVLIERLPSQSREQFEHFFLQLSFIASTTTRLRTAIQAGDVATVEEAMESAESMGVLGHLMKMIIAQAGDKVRSNNAEQTEWLAKTEDKIAPLLTSQGLAITVQKELAQARDKIGLYRTGAKDKTKKMMSNMSGGNQHGLLQSCFVQWLEVIKLDKLEAVILKEYGYEDQIAKVTERLFQMKQKQLEGSRNMLNRAHEQNQVKTMATIFAAFVDMTLITKRERENDGNLKAIEEKLRNTADNAAANAKRTMARIGNGNDESLLGMCLTAWKNFVVEYNKEKKMNDEIKAAESKVNAFMKKQKDGSKSVLARVSEASSSALQQSVFEGWRDQVKELLESRKMEEALNSQGGKMKSFQSKNKDSAKSINQKAAALIDMLYYSFCFNLMKKEWMVEVHRRAGKARNARRKEELVGVKGLFREFATSLDSTLKSGTPPVSPKSGQQPPGSGPR